MPNSILVVVLAVVFTAVLSVVQALYWAYVARLEREQEEVRRRIAGGSAQDFEQSLFQEQAADQAAKALGGLGERFQRTLIAADSGLTVTQLVTRMVVAGCVIGISAGIFLGPAGLAIGAVAAFLPYFVVSWQASARKKKLIDQLPDSLDLMARSLQAGIGLNDAFKLVGQEMPMPIAAEFGRVFEEVRFGRDYREAFHKMLARNDGIFELRLMVSSILLQRETGGNLIEILENISEMIRSRFAFEAKVGAMTSEAKTSAAILGALPLMVLGILTVSNPDYLEPLFNDVKGNVLLLIDFTMYSVGIFLMRDLSNVKV